MVQRQRMAGRALLTVGCNDVHVAEWLSRFREAFDAVREDAVVVRDQEPHQGD